MKWLKENAKWLVPLIFANIIAGLVALNEFENRVLRCEIGYTGTVQQMSIFVDELRNHDH